MCRRQKDINFGNCHIWCELRLLRRFARRNDNRRQSHILYGKWDKTFGNGHKRIDLVATGILPVISTDRIDRLEACPTRLW
jgi:hypothetical protein